MCVAKFTVMCCIWVAIVLLYASSVAKFQYEEWDWVPGALRCGFVFGCAVKEEYIVGGLCFVIQMAYT